MKVVHIMNYRIIIYTVMLFITTFSVSGINFNNFFKVRHELEAKLFVMLIILGLSFVSSRFIIDFIELF